MRRVANGALVLIVTVGGLNALARPYFGSTYHGMSSFLPRLVVGLIVTNTALGGCSSQLM
jgi:hypothetical protein